MTKATVGAMPGTDAWTIAVFPAKDVPVGTEVGPIDLLSITRDDYKFLSWLADRLVHVYGEKEGTDFVLATRRIAASMSISIEDKK